VFIVARQALNSSVFLIAVGFSPCGFSKPVISFIILFFGALIK
jgi:hypothetical protein